MVNSCCAFGCHSTSDVHPNLKFHRYVTELANTHKIDHWNTSRIILKLESNVILSDCSFPSEKNDNERRKKWIHAVRRKDFKPSQGSRICSRHFTEKDYDPPVISGPLRLKKTAIPSVFDFPEHLLPKQSTSG